MSWETSKIRKSGKLHPNFWNFFPEKRALASWMHGVCSSCLASRQLYFHRSEFLEKIPENRAGKLHTGKAARPGAINHNGQARCSIRSLPLRPSPALFPSTRQRKMGSSSFDFGGFGRRAAASETRKSGKLHPNFWRKSARQARPRAINDKGRARWNIGSSTYAFTSPFSFNSAAENGPFFFWFR
jgi:hypothetical protein